MIDAGDYSDEDQIGGGSTLQRAQVGVFGHGERNEGDDDPGQRDGRTSPGDAPLQASYESGNWKRVAKGGILDHTST
jgi:hypothetical protein